MKFAFLIIAALSATAPSISNAGSIARTMSKYEGLHESKNNITLRKALGVNPRVTPWCGYMMAFVVRKAGYKPPAGFASSGAWAKFGKRVSYAALRKGDVVVLAGRRVHHVGAFENKIKGKVCMRGGNTSNRVGIACYSTAMVVAYRRP